MNTHPPVSDLEALVAGTLDEDRSILISAHTDDCAVCGRELSWLRAERELFAQRARGVPPSEVWAQIEARIESRLSEQLVKAKTPAGGLRRRLLLSFQRERAQWYAVGAAAAAIFGIVAISPLSPLRKVIGPRRKRPRCVQSVRTCQRMVLLRPKLLITRPTTCQGSEESSSSSSHSLGQNPRFRTSICSSANWPTWLRRVLVTRRTLTERTPLRAHR